MTDEDDTPPIRILTDEERESHFDDYEPGTPIVQERPMSRDFAGHESGPSARMRQLEHEIEALQREQAQTRQVVESLAASRTATRKLLWLAIPALVTGLVTALVYAGDKIAASAERIGKTEAKLEAYKDRLDQQEAEIVQLRSALLKMSGIDPKAITYVRYQ